MYDDELIDFLMGCNIQFSLLNEGDYKKYSEMNNFPFVGSRISWDSLYVHRNKSYGEVNEFIKEIKSFIQYTNNSQIVLIGYDFENGYSINFSMDNLFNILEFLKEFPGENYLISLNEKWCICLYDSLDFGFIDS